MDPFPSWGAEREPIPWCDTGYYLPSRPSFTFDPFFHAGCYYVQEASSMFLEQAFRHLADLSAPLKVLDLCAAPGGKSTHIQSLISAESLLVSNEVIRSRALVLMDNIIKWGAGNTVLSNNDPADFGRLDNYFDVIVADAPCSGSGLFRRDPEAIREWSPGNVVLCSQRQQRILADVLPALKPGGLLLYSTCSYSREEDEDIVHWLQKEMGMINIDLQVPPDWQVIASGGGYRFWPDKIKGEGFFMACFRKPGEDSGTGKKTHKKPALATRAERSVAAAWAELDGKEVIRNEQTLYAWPAAMVDDFSLLLRELRLVYSGVKLGELVRDKMVPDHALAMSGLLSPSIHRLELETASAIQYLQKKEFSAEAGVKGWQVASFSGKALGWMNVLQNRINNYYPKELRILKDK